MSSMTYPWYTCVNGDDLEQGDILEDVPVLIPPTSLAADIQLTEKTAVSYETAHIITMSQTCDLVKGREKLQDVLFCKIFTRRETNLNPQELEEIRKGRKPPLHILHKCELPPCLRDFRVVDFRRVLSFPLSFVRQLAVAQRDRARLLPPYREQLSQAFARFFMRVGLPNDIPSFK